MASFTRKAIEEAFLKLLDARPPQPDNRKGYR